MKKLIIPVLALLAVGCQKEFTPSPAESEGVSKVSVSFDGVLSKASTTATDAEKTINALQVFVFDASGNYETSANVTIASDKKSASATATVKNGYKTFYAVANAPSISTSGLTLTSLKSKVLNLSDNLTYFEMSGSAETNVVADCSVSITMKRHVAKVCLTSFKRQFSDSGKAALELKVLGVWLSNMPGQFNLKNDLSFGSVTNWYNKLGKHEDASMDKLLYAAMGGSALANGSSLTSEKTLYGVRNASTSTTTEGGTWSPRVSRMVVYTTLAGLDNYYIVNLPMLQPNKVYSVNMTVTKEGSADPDKPGENLEIDLSATTTITVSNWDEVITITPENL